MNEAEIIYDAKHGRRDVVDGVVVWADDLPCDPECDPANGIHFMSNEEN